MSRVDQVAPVPPFRPSRGEVECMCLLFTLADRHLTRADLAERLGLSATLSGEMMGIVAPLVTEGWVEEQNGMLITSAAGRTWLDQRWRAAGLALSGGQTP